MSTFYPRTLPRIFSSRIQPCSLLSCPRAHTIRLSIRIGLACSAVCRIPPPSRVSHQGLKRVDRDSTGFVSQPRLLHGFNYILLPRYRAMVDPWRSLAAVALEDCREIFMVSLQIVTFSRVVPRFAGGSRSRSRFFEGV